MIRPARTAPGPARADALSDGLLALGIILSCTSSLRIGGLPLGPGEACLMAWLALRLSEEVWFRPSPNTRLTGLILGFWGVFALAQSVGLLRAMGDRGLIDWSAALHDAMSYTVMMLLTVLCLCRPDRGPRLARTVHLAMIVGSAVLGLQYAMASDLIAIPGVDPWYWDRFRGFAGNPNQLSLFCAVLVPVALVDLERGTRLSGRLPALACLVFALAAGLLTQSNSLRLTLVTGAGCSLLLLGWRSLRPRRRAPRPGDLLRVLALLALPAGALALVPFLATMRTETLAEHVSRNGAEVQGEAAVRFDLWEDAFGQGLDAHSLGLGPGPHARVLPAIVVRQRWEPGAEDPSLGDVAKHGAVMESHNCYVELFSQGGVVIVAAYAGLLALAMMRALRSGSVVLPAIVCVIAQFGIFHMVLRHPVVWFGLCLCLCGSELGFGRRPYEAVPRRTPAGARPCA